MPKSKFCNWHDHQECCNREDARKYCECDCHTEEGWIDAELMRWRIDTLPVSRGTVVDLWFRDKLGGQEWLFRVGVWSAAKMVGVPVPAGMNPLSLINATQVISHLKKETRYQIKLSGYRQTMHKYDETVLKIQYVRVKKQEALEGE